MKRKIYLLVIGLTLPLLLMGQSTDTTVLLSLSDCQQMAQQNDPAIKNAQLEVLAAHAQRQEALSHYFPNVSITALGLWSLHPMLKITLEDILGPSPFTTQLQSLVNHFAPQLGINTRFEALRYGYAAQLMISQPLYAGGRIVTGNRLAHLGEQIATLQSIIQQRTSLETVQEKYNTILFLLEKEQTLQQLQELIDTLEGYIQTAVESGLKLKTDLLQIQLRQGEIQQGLSKLKQSIRLAKMDLFNLIGQDFTLLQTTNTHSAPHIDHIHLSPKFQTLQPPSTIYLPEEEIVNNLEEMELLNLSIVARTLEKRQTLGEALPQVVIGANYGYSQAIHGDLNGSAYAMIQIPLSDWGAVSQKVKRQDYLLQQAKNNKEYLAQQLLLQIRQLWLEVTSSWDELILAEENLTLAEKTWDDQSHHYQVGLITLAELLQSQALLQQAKEAHLEAKIAYRNAVTTYTGRIRKKQP